MKTIEYDQQNYEIIRTIETENATFQSIKFSTGYYGIKIILPEENKNDIMLITTNKTEIYTNLFLETMRTSTEKINNINDNIDEVTLVIQLNTKQSEIFQEVITKNQANDLIERLKITNEIIDMQTEEKMKNNTILYMIVIFSFLITIILILNKTGVIK